MAVELDSGIPSAVPIWPALVAPVLEVLRDGEALHRRDVFDRAAKIADLTEAARAETLNSGGFRYEQRIGWALTHLSKAGWVDRPARATYSISPSGRAWLDSEPGELTYATAREIFSPFWPKESEKAGAAGLDSSVATLESLEPVEQIEDAINRIQVSVGDELLCQRRLKCRPGSTVEN
ncbi:winged helix-turn-helix domain-containing protein [Subtercola sp. PAMC28395]|uniref:winged helix-turn-helix domain-containing protein n=1 Tax=Subtercola sp. PAMC28395 TaxID=2846775 RepID=UPI001C0C6D27|nr:winged helix-turn-helix domain-containing protein [Subtercola sp. PAMC28395]